MGFRRLVEKGGEDAEMIRFASITTGFRFSEIILLSKRKGRRVKTDRFFAAIPTLSRCIVLPPRFFLHDSSEKRGCSGTPKSLISSPCPELVPWSNVLETLRSVRSLGEIIAPRKEIVHGEFLEASVRGTSPHKFIDRSCKTPRRAAWTYVDRTFSPPQVFPRWMESNLWLWLSSIRRCVSSVPRFRIRRAIFSISIRREGGREGKLATWNSSGAHRAP